MTRIIRYLEASGSQTAGWYLYVDGTVESAIDFAQADATQFVGKETIWLDGATPSDVDAITGGGGNDVFLAKSDLDTDVLIEDTTGENILVFEAGFVATKVELVSASVFGGSLEQLEISFASAGSAGTTRKITVKSLDTIKFQLGAGGTAITAAAFATANPSGFTVVATSNEAPIIAEGDSTDDGLLAVNVAEGSTAVATIAATDADGDDITYSITGGADAGKFAINASTGELTFKTAPDFEAPNSDAGSNTYVVIVTATDDSTGTDTLTITVTVTNANDVTLDFSAAVTPIVENVDHSSTAADVAVLTSTDDSGATVSYKIVTSASDVNAPASTPFSIVESGGRQILRYTGPALNHEATASLVVYVEATSSDGDTAIKAINVGVTNANDAPILVANKGVSFNADETSVTLTRAHLLVSDEDSGNTITFTIVAPDFGALKLSGTVLRTGNTFTMDDVTAGKVTYEPTAGTPTDAILGFTYSDGTFTSALQTFKFDVREKTAVEVGDNALDLSSKKIGQEVITDDGQDQITDGQGDDYIEAGRGDDTVDLSTGGADTIAYNFDVASDDSVVAIDGNNHISGFTRGNDRIVFKTDASETKITSLDAFLKDGQGKPNDDFADDKFIVTIDFEIIKGTGGAANSAVLTGLTFHFRESAVYGGNKLSMPIFQINFATPIAATDDILAALGGASNLDFGRGLALKKLVEVNSAGEVTENYVANILGADSIDFVQDEAESLTLTGDAGHNKLTGGALDDTLSGLGGDDWLIGGAGDDKLYGGAGDDILDGGAGDDILDGGAGDDDEADFDYSASTSDLTLDLTDATRWKQNADGTWASGTGAGYEYQRLVADGETDYFKNIEDFTLIGGSGDDILTGSEYYDRLNGGAGNDILDGGVGWHNDVAVFDYSLSTADLTLDVTDTTRWKQNNNGTWSSGTGVGYEYQRLVAGDETDYYKNIESVEIIGGSGDDILIGSGYDTTLNGGAGNDILSNGYAVFDYSSSTSDLTLDLSDTTRWKQNSNGTWASGIGAEYAYERLVVGDETDYFKNINYRTLIGGSGDDTLIADESGAELEGGDGDDTLTGGAGDDRLDGGDGNDKLDGGGGDDWGEFSYFSATAGLTLDATAASYWKQDSNGDWTQTGATSADYRRFEADGETDYFKNIENFFIVTGSGDDVLTTGAGGESLHGGSGNDILTSGAGDDSLQGDAGNDILDGGAGDDDATFDYGSSTSDLTLDATDTTRWKQNSNGTWSSGTGAGYEYQRFVADGETDYFKNIEDFTLIGGSGDDRLYGGDGWDRLYGGAGNDILTGSGGYLYGGAGDDTLTSSGDHGTLYGGAGDDTLTSSGDRGTLYGGAGDDTLTSSGAYSDLYGGAGNDVLTSSGDRSTLYGGADNDILNGDYGDDKLYGGDGRDLLIGNGGDDILDGGAGDDGAVFYYGSAAANLTLDVTATTYWKQDSNGDWTQTGATSADYRRFYADLDNDGNEDIDDVYDYFKNIEIFFLVSGDGDDTLSGGVGNDRLDGGDGNDILDGGAGDDTFVLNLSGTSNDFTAVLDFSNTTGNDDKIRVDTTNGNESSLAALKAAANIYWTNNSNFSSSSGTNNASINDTVIYTTKGTADTSDDFALMMLEDYTTELTFADFDIV